MRSDLSSVKSNGNTIQYLYDADGWPSLCSRISGGEWPRAGGRPFGFELSGAPSVTGYDRWGFEFAVLFVRIQSLAKITLSRLHDIQLYYDSHGRRTSLTDQNGKTTTYAYDHADRLTSVTDAAQDTDLLPGSMP